MMKKLLAVFLCICMAVSLCAVGAGAVDSTSESAGTGAKVASIGNTQYDTLAAAVTAAGSGDTIKLLADVTGRLAVTGGKTLTLDLNNHTLSNSAIPVFIKHGTLYITGTGTVQEADNDGYGAVYIYGSNDPTATNYSVIHVGKDVTLGGWAGIMIDQYYDSGTTAPHAYGVVVDFSGTIVTPALSTHTAAGSGIYINGAIQDTTNCPKITIGETAKITDTITHSHVIYAAGYADWTINGGTFSGENGIEIKAGSMTINGGTFTATATPTVHTPDNGGWSTYGYALSVVNNKNYGHPLTVTVNGGNFNGPVAVLDDDADTTNNYSTASITGGYFTSEPDSALLASGYKAVSGSWTIDNKPYTYRVGVAPANKIESAVATAYADTAEDTGTEVLASVSSSVITVTGKLPSADNKVIVTYTNTDSTSGTVTLTKANDKFAPATVTVGGTAYTVNVDNLAVLPATVTVAAPTVEQVPEVAASAPQVSKDAVTALNAAISNPTTAPSADGLSGAVVNSALTTTTNVQGATEVQVTTSEGTKSAAEVITAQQAAIPEGTGNAVLAAIKTNTDANPAVVTVVPVLKIIVTEPTIVNGEERLTIDISALSQVVVTTQAVAAAAAQPGGTSIDTEGSGQNAIPVGAPVPVTVNNEVTITVPIPDSIATVGTLYVRHSHNGTETVPATIAGRAGAYTSTFTLKGLSEVVFLNDTRTCTIRYYSDTAGTSYETKTITPADTGSTAGAMTMPAATAPSGYSFTGWKLSADGVTGYDGTYTQFTDAMLTAYAGKVVEAKPVYTQNDTGSSSGTGTAAYAITASAGANGTVTPAGKTSVTAGRDQTYTITPNAGYAVEDVLVDGKSVGAVTTYTFKSVSAAHTISAAFRTAAAFTDVPAGFWAASEISWAASKGYMNGVTSASFDVNGSITRQQLWMVLARISGQSPADMAAARAWAMSAGVSDGTRPTAPVSRQQMAVSLYRFAKLKGYDTSASASLSAFSDSASVAAYAAEAMPWAVGAGLVKGADGKLLPVSNATRAQFAVILYRFCQSVVK